MELEEISVDICLKYRELLVIPKVRYVQVADFVCVCVCVLFRAIPTTYGGSQARAWVWAVAAGHSYSHSNMREIRATSVTYTAAHGSAGSLTHWGQGSNLRPHGY